jgi:ubiquinone/menaquinone biosynthesis C-methylase UbiE
VTGRPSGGGRPKEKLKAPLSWRFSQQPKLFRLVSSIENLFEWGPGGPPKVEGPADLHDLLKPGMKAAGYPAYYINKPVHRMRGLGFLDPQQPAFNDKVMKAIPYIRADRIVPWIEEHVRDAGVQPKKIIDVGAGSGTTARAYAEVFPDAEVYAIDLAPPQLRAGMRKAEAAGLKNITWLQMDSGDMSYFETDSFDVVHVAHVLHEMDTEWIEKTVRESIRICKTGGVLAFFDWRIPRNEEEWKHREAMVRVGQEPYMVEYAKANFPELMRKLDCELVDVGQEGNSATWITRKGARANELLGLTAATA